MRKVDRKRLTVQAMDSRCTRSAAEIAEVWGAGGFLA
jgi:hypothetical protein